MIRTERERESKNPTNQQQKSRLESEINDLANKPNKTEEEKRQLEEKKKDLEKLNNQNSEQDKGKNKWIKPVLIIGSVILVSGLVIYFIKRNSKR